MHDDEMEWSPEEREALARLPREEDPGRLLEEKTVAALRSRGLLAPPTRGTRAGSADGAPGRSGPTAWRHPAWWAAGVAAALALFMAGLTVGGIRANAAAMDLVLALHTAEAAERPSLVQQTGSLYVDAVASLATARAEGNEEAVGTGVEVGLAALYAAAYELARLHPDDPRLRDVLDALDRPLPADSTRDVHWF